MNTVNEHFRNEEQMESRLWDYIDGLCNDAERTLLDRLIVENKEWRTKHNELLQLHATFNLVQLEEPSMRFTKNVMEEITKTYIAPATKSYINQKVIWGIAAFFITIIASFAIYGFVQTDWSLAPEHKTSEDFTSINYNKVFDNSYVNLFIMINIVLGLLLFDRYLSSKKKKLLRN